MNTRSSATTLTVGLVGGLLIAGCVTDQANLGSNAGETFEEFKARAYKEPFPDGVYIIDGDTPVTDEAELYQAWSQRQQGALAVYSINATDIKWSATQKLNLTYCISDAFGANKAAMVTAMREATENGWERFADVNFRYLSSQDATCNAQNANVLFDVNPVNSNGQYLARAFFPNDARVNRNVLVDNSSFAPNLSVPLKGILGHELGHVLGFRHEHIRPTNTPCAEDNQFRGLTAYDQASVMHYPQCNGVATSQLAFTTLDQQGVALLYGAVVAAPVAQFTAPAAGASVTPAFTVQTSIVGTDLTKVELYVDGTLNSTATVAPYTFSLTGVSAGAHTLQLKAYDARDHVTTETRAVTVSGGSGNGNGTGGGGGGGTGGGDGGGDDTEITGGCSTSGSRSSLMFGLMLGALALRRRRR